MNHPPAGGFCPSTGAEAGSPRSEWKVKTNPPGDPDRNPCERGCGMLPFGKMGKLSGNMGHLSCLRTRVPWKHVGKQYFSFRNMKM